MSDTVLFCIPYAGGIAEVTYGKWQKALGENIQVIPLEPAGHGRRMREPFASTIEATALDFLPHIKQAISEGKKYALYAHSMGTLIAYELVKAIIQARLMEPEAMFLSGRLPPNHQYSGPDLHELSDNDLVESLKKVEGSPKDLFVVPALVETFLPIIRSDYRLTETYTFKPPVISICGSIHCFYSDNDSLVNLQDMYEWRHFCRKDFVVHQYSGHHFFINDHYVDICNEIRNALSEAVCI
ncbi:thioesterase II family protein [Saccharophagus degradans]|uniref:Alpha/beta fold hydrolase n=1 Tax=Saccharophagus degradans TaxID=86304 RepID=A0AAW7X188_9GAMM|nr:alpha/beta fold hydrolase [Saccharophagus degradans]MDO6421244.1 alpha/beta fold hydrolase [Saccharophagus degradans]MDO6605845.1 alpha/beta fold hydrolase [Saccharophagus degradans]